MYLKNWHEGGITDEQDNSAIESVEQWLSFKHCCMQNFTRHLTIKVCDLVSHRGMAVLTAGVML